MRGGIERSGIPRRRCLTILHPQIVLVRMCTDATKPVALQYGYSNGIQGLFLVARDEGSAALYRGVGPNVIRSVLMSASFSLTSLASYKSPLRCLAISGVRHHQALPPHHLHLYRQRSSPPHRWPPRRDDRNHPLRARRRPQKPRSEHQRNGRGTAEYHQDGVAERRTQVLHARLASGVVEVDVRFSICR